MDGARHATVDDRDLLADVAATGFFDDPVLGWIFADADRRLEQLRTMFGGLADDTLPDRGTVHVVDDACVAFWREPGFSEGRPAADRARARAEQGEPLPYPSEVMGRLDTLGEAMKAVHPHEPHWYLNVVATRPERRGQGLGAQVLAPVLARADADGVPAYLESTNPRNVPFYERHGFVRTGTVALPDGPSLTTMWRSPRA